MVTVQTQDDMFIRFSADESINEYTIEATNTAGSQRLQDGTRIVGALVAKENILVWTDNALIHNEVCRCTFYIWF